MLYRLLSLGVLLSLLVSAAPLMAQNDDCEDGFFLFEHAFGETCIPEEPERIVTTSDQNGLLPLLELGVRPVGSAGRLLDDDTTQFRRVDEYDTEGIVGVGDFLSPNLEAILELDPDLIVGYEFFSDEIYDELSEIAPTVLIQVFGRPLDEVLLDFAAVVGETEAAEELAADYEARVDTLLTDLGERADNLTISVLTSADNAGEFWDGADGQALGTVMADLALNRPDPEESEEAQDAPWSIETLSEHDADVMLIIDFSGELNDPVVQEFVDSPLFGTLGVAQAEQVYIIDGTQTVGTSWGKMNTFLAELETILLDPELDVDVVEEPESDE
ncbi:MAG: ABC transporter substrate-binding protein [Anaerolineales bacterium]